MCFRRKLFRLTYDWGARKSDLRNYQRDIVAAVLDAAGGAWDFGAARLAASLITLGP
jgi:hypothetical protein